MKGKIISFGNNTLKIKLDTKDYNKFFNADGSPNKKRADVEINYKRRKYTDPQRKYIFALYGYLIKNNYDELLACGGETRTQFDELIVSVVFETPSITHEFFKKKATQDQIIPVQFLDEKGKVSLKKLDVYYTIKLIEYILIILERDFLIDLSGWYAFAEREGIEKPK